jgi:hypothetical protein
MAPEVKIYMAIFSKNNKHSSLSKFRKNCYAGGTKVLGFY